MKLSQLLAVDRDVDITGISVDSRTVKPGELFICLKGKDYDGHTFAREALAKGAAAVVTEEPLGIDGEILLPDTRRAAACIYAAWYGNPQNKLKIVGVTGTNGKTSVVNLLNAVYQAAGYKTAVSGTLGTFWEGKSYPAENTTARPESLYSWMDEMVRDGVEYLFMEVSSHSLMLDRVAEISFRCGIYTNLTAEHLDFHRTMENYAAAKARLFSQSAMGIFNYDDLYSYITSQNSPCVSFGYGRGHDPDFRLAEVLQNNLSGISYRLDYRGKSLVLKSPLAGEFNIYNTLAAASCALADGLSEEAVVEGLAAFRGVPGRLERLYDGLFTVFIDYAHTPDALTRVLEVLRQSAFGHSARPDTGQNAEQKSSQEKHRLRLLFGCGGDRDKSKRPVMGNIAATLADEVIVTSDNARSEDPDAIIRDILSGVSPEKQANSFRVIKDRTEALTYAIDTSLPGDILLVAGKGHEDYEIDCHGRHPFSEKKILSERLRASGLLS